MSESPLMLSASGLRGVIGQSLTPPVAARYAAAFGQWLRQTRAVGDGAPHVVLGRDSRPSGRMIELAAASGLMGVGCRVTSLGIVATPSVAIMTEHLQADGGMVITASHNPIEWNGIKLLRCDGVAPDPDQVQQIIHRFKSDDVSYVPVQRMMAMAEDATTHQVHIDRVLAHIDTESIRQRQIKVVIDSVHGAGGDVAAMMMDQLGVELVHLYAEPTGQFPHLPEPTRETLTELCDVVLQNQADIGFAQDPDADRLAVVDEKGQYIGEEYSLALASLRVLSRTDCPPNAAIVANLSTSRMIDDIACKMGTTVTRTPVGEANVAAAIRSSSAVIGGEGNGGVIWPKVIHVRDSLAGIALLLELLVTRETPLSTIVDEIPHYSIVKDKIRMESDMGLRYAAALQSHYTSQKIDLQDGVRINWQDRWVHVRPSNTEPILRIIAEANSEASARQLIADTRQVLGVA